MAGKKVTYSIRMYSREVQRLTMDADPENVQMVLLGLKELVVKMWLIQMQWVDALVRYATRGDPELEASVLEKTRYEAVEVNDET